jgi:hypothetical protein
MKKKAQIATMLMFFACLLAACNGATSSVPTISAPTARTAKDPATPSRTANTMLNSLPPGATPGFPNGYIVFTGDQFSMKYPDGWEADETNTTNAPSVYTFASQDTNFAVFGVTINTAGAPLDIRTAATKALGVSGSVTPISALPSAVQSAWNIFLSNTLFEIHALSYISPRTGDQIVIAFGTYNDTNARDFAVNYRDYFWPMLQSARFNELQSS